ncbi:acid protease [Zopfia rhizophila CBS 207.26]|uniref:Acid protease n=1 Tax=Zopfia rhizophila CBS 207.26 TaxID=1314779 RepID=A0A6A6DCH1_9PEZI|nr:acid protease [Zopfia rhizophila CBS 207.26]
MYFSPFSVVVVSSILALAKGGVFRLPITRTTIGWDIRFFYESSHKYSYRGDGDIIFWSTYTTPVSIGNPPLNLDAIVDTSWGPIFIPSVNCTYDDYEKDYCLVHPLYNSSLSSTYRENLTATKLAYWSYSGVYTNGNISLDSLHVADLEIKDQEFEEVTWWRPGYLTRDDIFDTVLGLALHRTFDEWGNFGAPSPFQNMVDQERLNENLFTLQLPRTDHERGEITLGGLPENVTRNKLIEVPLDHSKDSSNDRFWDFYTSNGWQVSIQNMSMCHGCPYATRPILTEEHTAIISSSHPYISLPGEAARRANEYIGLEEIMDWVDCEDRSSLPDLMFTFGSKGESITLTPWDYLIEVYDDLYEQLKCVSAFEDLEGYGEQGFIILGAPFLNGVYSVWDANRQSISFRNRPM